MSAIGYQRSVDYPMQILSAIVRARPGTVVWAVAPRVQRNRAALITRGETMSLPLVVETAEVPSKGWYVWAQIFGDGSTTQAAAITLPPP